MRDPWKALAAVLALALCGITLLLDPGPEPGNRLEIAASEEQATPSAGPKSLAGRMGSIIERRGAIGATANGLVLVVRVQNEAGEPIAANISLVAGDRGPDRRFSRAGAACFARLSAEPLTLEVTAQGYLQQRETLLLASAPAEQEHLVVLTPATALAVRFLAPDGRRLRDVLQERWPIQGRNLMPYLRASDGHDPSPLPPTATDYFRSPLGEWRGWSELNAGRTDSDGTLFLTSHPPVQLIAMLRNHTLGSLRLEAAMDRLDFVVDPEAIAALCASLRLRLLDADGQPVAKGMVMLTGGSSAPILRCEDGTGVYAQDGFAPGPLQVFCAVQGGWQVSRAILLESGMHLDLGDLHLRQATLRKARILDAAGNAVGGMSGMLWSAEDGRISLQTTSRLRGDAEGWIAWSATAALHTLALTPPEGSTWAAAAMTQTADGAAVEVRLCQGVPVQFRAQGEDYLLRRVWVLVDGSAPAGGWSAPRLPQTVRLAPGRHAWLLADDAGNALRREDLTVREGEPELVVEVPFE